MIRVSLLISIFILLIFFVQVNFPRQRGLCIDTETSFFSCETSQQKLISLCGGLPSMLHYRFGVANQIEFEYPENAILNTNNFSYADYVRFQTERIEVSFRKSGIEYSIFDYTENGNRQAGVRIITADEKESEIICSEKITSQLQELKILLRCDSESALNLGNCP